MFEGDFRVTVGYGYGSVGLLYAHQRTRILWPSGCRKGERRKGSERLQPLGITEMSGIWGNGKKLHFDEKTQ